MESVDELIGACEALSDLGYKVAARNGAIAVLNKLSEIGIQVKGQKQRGRGVTLLVSKSDVESLKNRFNQKNQNEKENSWCDKHKMECAIYRADYNSSFLRNAMNCLAAELGVRLCECGKKFGGKDCEDCKRFSVRYDQ
jgi:hypothetical protein